MQKIDACNKWRHLAAIVSTLCLINSITRTNLVIKVATACR